MSASTGGGSQVDVLDRKGVLLARKQWTAKKRSERGTGTKPTDEELKLAGEDLDKSERTFSSPQEVADRLEDHLVRIGPPGRSRQEFMFPKAPNATGGYGKKVSIRPPRGKDHERAAQLLKHISQLVFASIQGLTQEVECLYVNGVLVIAGNEARAAEKFVELAGLAAKEADVAANGRMLQQLVAMALLSDQRKVSDRLSNAAGKLVNLADGRRTKSDERPGDDAEMDPGVRARHQADADDFASLAALIDAAHVPAVRHTAAAATEAIKTGTPQVVYLHDSEIHAEQQLVRILVASKLVDQRATIRGTKRACFGCYLALEYARRYQGVALLDHGTRPGGYWLNSCQSAHEFILEHPGTQTKEQAHAWVMSTGQELQDSGVNRTRRLTATQTRRTPGAVVSTTNVRSGDGNADTDSESEPDEGSMSAELKALVSRLRVKRPPKPRKKKPEKKPATTSDDEEMLAEAVDEKASKKVTGTKRKATAPERSRGSDDSDVDESDEYDSDDERAMDLSDTDSSEEDASPSPKKKARKGEKGS